MRKNVFGRQFSRDRNERKALFKGLLSALVMNGRIETTLEKAKAIRPSADRLITKARRESLLARRLLEQDLIPVAVEKLMNEIAPRFSKRSGGYTRIIKLGRRFSDKASTAFIEWVEGEPSFAKASEGQGKVKKVEPKKKSSKTKIAKPKTEKSKKTSKQKTVKKGASR